MMNDREKALRRVQEAGFMTDDLRLFLDTHPENDEAFRALKHYIDAEQNVKEKYEKQYGALTLEAAVQHRQYDWVRHAWPWEVEG